MIILPVMIFLFVFSLIGMIALAMRIAILCFVWIGLAEFVRCSLIDFLYGCEYGIFLRLGSAAIWLEFILMRLLLFLLVIALLLFLVLATNLVQLRKDDL